MPLDFGTSASYLLTFFFASSVAGYLLSRLLRFDIISHMNLGLRIIGNAVIGLPVLVTLCYLASLLAVSALVPAVIMIIPAGVIIWNAIKNKDKGAKPENCV